MATSDTPPQIRRLGAAADEGGWREVDLAEVLYAERPWERPEVPDWAVEVREYLWTCHLSLSDTEEATLELGATVIKTRTPTGRTSWSLARDEANRPVLGIALDGRLRRIRTLWAAEELLRDPHRIVEVLRGAATT
jgi:hypothetical protein